MNRDPMIGKRLGKHVLQAALPRAGLGRVYLAQAPDTEGPAIVRVIQVTDGAASETLTRFRPIAPAILGLKHPRIVGLREFGESNGAVYFAMEHVPGADLRRILAELTGAGKRLTASAGLRILEDVADALDHAHSQGVLHGDVRPASIIVGQDGRASLGDFGIAAALHPDLTDQAAEPPFYLAPERFASPEHAGPASDLYSLAVVLYEMLTGRVPFDDPYPPAVALQHMRLRPPSPRTLNPGLHPTVEQVILRALEKEAQARYTSGTALYQALAKAVAEGGGLEPEGPTREGLGRAASHAAARSQATPPPAPAEEPAAAPALPGGERASPRPRARALKLPRPPKLKRLTLPRTGRTAWIAAGGLLLILFVASSVAVISAIGRAGGIASLFGGSPVAIDASGDPAYPNVLIVYDSLSASVINSSPETISLSGVAFRRMADDGSFNNTFPADVWESVAPRSTASLPPGACLRLLRSVSQDIRPAACQGVRAWFATTRQEWHFWLSDPSSPFFAVFQDDTLVHLCPIADGSCTFHLPQPES